MRRLRSAAHARTENPRTPRSSIAEVRLDVCSRVIGDLFVRLARADGWQFATFPRAGGIGAAFTSAHATADLEGLRAEIRLQRVAGSSLPYVGATIAAGEQRSLCVILGDYRGLLAIVRVERLRGAPFVARDWSGLERFVRQHADGIISTLLADSGANDRAWHERDAPIAFTVDSRGALLAWIDGPEPDAMSLHAQFVPRSGQIPAPLASVIGELLERYGRGEGTRLVSNLPFVVVRLCPLVSGAVPAAFLVTVQPLRRPASLGAMAEQYSIGKRELQVLDGMLQGAAVAQVAKRLSICESTVVFHLKRMLRKTGARNRVELVARVLGWEPDPTS